jgi:hypothetical protein
MAITTGETFREQVFSAHVHVHAVFQIFLAVLSDPLHALVLLYQSSFCTAQKKVFMELSTLIMRLGRRTASIAYRGYDFGLLLLALLLAQLKTGAAEPRLSTDPPNHGRSVKSLSSKFRGAIPRPVLDVRDQRAALMVTRAIVYPLLPKHCRPWTADRPARTYD